MLRGVADKFYLFGLAISNQQNLMGLCPKQIGAPNKATCPSLFL